jgi:hypothetical protein
VSDETVTPLDDFDAPYGRRVKLQDVLHESGLRMLRVRIREGSRFTIMDLDGETASRWGAAMARWAETEAHR